MLNVHTVYNLKLNLINFVTSCGKIHGSSYPRALIYIYVDMAEWVGCLVHGRRYPCHMYIWRSDLTCQGTTTGYHYYYCDRYYIHIHSHWEKFA